MAKRHGVSEQSIYTWRKRFGSFQPDDVRRLKQLEQESARLKKLVAEREMEIEVMKEIAAKMYDLPRRSKGRCRPDDGSPPKCIRPLASELLLQPGHHEIRALRPR
jgi:putative transposase